MAVPGPPPTIPPVTAPAAVAPAVSWAHAVRSNSAELAKKDEHVFLTKRDAVTPKVVKEKLAKLKKIKIQATPISILDEASLEAVKKILNKIASEGPVHK